MSQINNCAQRFENIQIILIGIIKQNISLIN